MNKKEDLEVLPTKLETEEELLQRFLSMGYDEDTALSIIRNTKKGIARQMATSEDTKEESSDDSIVSRINEFLKNK